MKRRVSKAENRQCVQSRLFLNCSLGAGDVVLLTAAIRDLHREYPKRFSVHLQSEFPELYENNPDIIPRKAGQQDGLAVDCVYPLIDCSNSSPHHVLYGFIQFLNDKLELQIKPIEFKGHIPLADDEKVWDSQVQELVGEGIPFWLVVAGGKHDVTIKWWETRRYQKVVDHFRGKIQFVQVGAMEHHHPKLDGVIDLRGQTNLRQLIRLMYHAQGVLCPVTLAMHLAAAVEVKGGTPKNRPCVVIAGGREPAQWEAYPHHQYIHTNGALLCCDNGGCWKSRTVPLGDGDERDRPENLCVDVVQGKTPLPRCMDMITSDEVVRRIEWYFKGGAISYLTLREARLASKAVEAGESRKWNPQSLDAYFFRQHAERSIKAAPRFPKDRFKGRGIVICAGGQKYFPCAWVAVKMLRQLGCMLPVEFWHLGPAEMSRKMKALVKPLGVECVDSHEIRKQFPARMVNGWPLKAYALLHSSFEEVLFLDADNVPTMNPEYLFETPEYVRHGAVFWPDPTCLAKGRAIWEITGVSYRKEPAFESGQMMVDKARCWKALNLAMHYNEHADFYYHHIYGDKDTFHFAFRKVKKSYAMPDRGPHFLIGTMCQHDFEGGRIFQHRIKKWKLEGNSRTPGFLFEEECIGYLDELRELLAGGERVDRIDKINRIKGMKRNGIVPNPAPPTVELVKLRKDDARMVKHRGLLNEVAKREFAYPAERFAGRGIVICGGGAKYFPCVYVLVRLLRHLGCELPVEVWHLGAKEMTPAMRALLEEAGKLAASPTESALRCVDGRAVRRVQPARRLGGWELKCYAVLHSRFSEVLLLDADNCPVRDPGFLFDAAQYRKLGAVFWPDFGRFKRGQAVWMAAGVKYRNEPEFESGQMVIDKARCWRALNVAMHLNEHSEWWYRLVHGDKDTFHIAWRKIGQEYAMPAHPVRALDGVMLQYDFAGRLLFQHRNFGKWTLENNRRIPGFRLEKECLGFVNDLRVQWVELPPEVRRYRAAEKSAVERAAAERLGAGRWEYRRVGHDFRAMTFLPDGRVGEGARGCEVYWELREVQGRLRLEVFSPECRTFSAWEDGAGGWVGRWERFEGMRVELGEWGKTLNAQRPTLNAQGTEGDSGAEVALEEAVA